jgi:hypothetical protein
MTTTMPEPCPIDFARPLGGLEHLFSLIDRTPDGALLHGRADRGTHVDSSVARCSRQLQERHPLLSVFHGDQCNCSGT